MQDLTIIQQTMTSREIADLVESRHDKVKQSIERLTERGVIAKPPMGDIPFVDASGRNRTESAYLVGKRDSYIIVAQLSPEFTARLVDRWQELEAKVQISNPALPDFTNPAEAARAWASEYEQKHVALEQLEAAQPAIEFHGRVGDADSLHSIDETAKVLRAPPMKFRRYLKDTLQLFRLDGLPKQPFLNSGYVRTVETILPHTGKPYPQTFFTGKGLQWIQRKLDHSLLGQDI